MHASFRSATRATAKTPECRAGSYVRNSVWERGCKQPASGTLEVKLARFTPKSSTSFVTMRFYFGLLALSALLVPLSGCVSADKKISAIRAVNEDFRQEYEPIIRQEGTRVFKASEAQAFAAMESSLRKLGMTIEAQDSSAGYLRAAAPAPQPLTREEWGRVAEADLPRMRRVVKEHVGFMGGFIKFEPEGLDIVINVTTIEVSGGKVEVSTTMRMRETAPPKTGYPRREYPPPTAVRMGIAKFWSRFETELDRIKSN